MASIKILRLQKELKKMFNTVVLYSLRDDRLKGVYFSDVDISPDLRQAKVYFYDSSSEISHKELEACLTRASGVFKKTIAEAKIMRVIPEFRFFYDKSQENSSKIESILNKINKENRAYEDESQEYEDYEDEDDEGDNEQ